VAKRTNIRKTLKGSTKEGMSEGEKRGGRRKRKDRQERTKRKLEGEHLNISSGGVGGKGELQKRPIQGAGKQEFIHPKSGVCWNVCKKTREKKNSVVKKKRKKRKQGNR